MIPIVYQFANSEFQKTYNGIKVYGVSVKSSWSLRRKSKILFENCLEEYNSNEDIIIFATDFMGVKNNEKRVIGIQHGISWDVGVTKKTSHYKNLLYVFLKGLFAFKTVIRVSRFNLLVCVDYNFLNWYRTQVGVVEMPIKVIPNCTEIKQFIKKDKDNVNIIFARRFYEYRGTKLFSSVLNRILDENDNVYATFAGNGPDEAYLKELFDSHPQVRFITYESEDSIEIHKEFQIAIVPTIGSEGTSLSLLEAMSAKCAVIATNVGGMTNIILDKYNGLMINPDEVELYEALTTLIKNKAFREEIANNGFLTVSKAFNKELWEERWTKVLNDII